jgi:hypothetical protein
MRKTKSATCHYVIFGNGSVSVALGKPVESEPAMNNSSIGLLTWAGIDGTVERKIQDTMDFS